MINFKKNKGDSLIEVLVASIILAVGILGCLQLQTKSLKFLLESADYTQAALIVDSVSNQVRNQVPLTPFEEYSVNGRGYIEVNTISTNLVEIEVSFNEKVIKNTIQL